MPPDELAEAWVNRHRKNLTSDYDQATFLIGACVPGSGINAQATLDNPAFRPHPALGAVLEWLAVHLADPADRAAARTACAIHATWSRQRNAKASAAKEELLFDIDPGDD